MGTRGRMGRGVDDRVGGWWRRLSGASFSSAPFLLVRMPWGGSHLRCGI